MKVGRFLLLLLVFPLLFLSQAKPEPVAALGSVPVVLEGDSSVIGPMADFSAPDINDADMVAFYARTSGVPPVYGVFRDDWFPNPIAADGPSSEGVLAFGPPFILTFGEPPVINLAGQIGFSAAITNPATACPTPPCKAIFKGDPTSISTIVAEKQAAPGGGTLGPPTLLDFTDSQQALYVAPVSGKPYTYALFLSGLASQPVAYVGQTLPAGAGGGTITGFGREDGAAAGTCTDGAENGTDGAIDFLDPDCRFASLDNSSPNPRVVFHATVSGGSSPEGIYLAQGTSPISAVVRAGSSTWQGDLGFGATLTGVGQPSINDLSGQVAFWGTSSGPYGSGYFLASLSSPHEDGSASCFDGSDNGGDTTKDDGDTDCTSSTAGYEDSNASCIDGIDNGGDTTTDANDPDCQLVATKQALENDPSPVGDVFGGGGGCTFGLKGGLSPTRLNEGGQLVVVGCGGDPTEAIITVPHFHKQVIVGESLGLTYGTVVSVGNPSISRGTPSQDSKLAWGGSSSAGPPTCSSPPCNGIFKVQPSCTMDGDGDGLNYCWETNGVDIDNNGTIDLDLPAMGANAFKKDIFIEVDFMDCGQKGCGSEDGAGLGTCGDGMDNTGDTNADLNDADCNVAGADSHHHKPIVETVWNYEDGAGSGTCTDTKDNGKDGLTDAADPDCGIVLAIAGLAEDGFPTGTCNDGLDNGGDGATDAADADCKVGTVVQGFANAPVSNPAGGSGINLHVIVDEAIPHRQYMNFWKPEDGTASCTDHKDNGSDGKCDSGVGCTGGDAGKPADPDCGLNGLGFEDENASCTDTIDNGGDTVLDNPAAGGDPDCGVYDFDSAGGKPTYFGTATERADANWNKIKKARRQVFHYVIFSHQQSPGGQIWNPGGEDGGLPLTCGDGVDNGLDGAKDAADIDCKGRGSSGLAEIWGNDLMVSLGAFAHEDNKQAASCFNGVDDGHDGSTDLADADCTSGVVGDQDEHEGTFMHELGHNLNLRHGGFEDVNYKPNYLSVMNYSFQFDWWVGKNSRPLDYSRWVLPLWLVASAREDGAAAGSCTDNQGEDRGDPDCQPVLVENDLNEDRGIDTWGAPPAPPFGPPGWNTSWKWTLYSLFDPATTKCLLSKVSIVGAIDWDGDTVIEGNTKAAPNNNNITAFINDPRGPGGPMCASDPDRLSGFEDWSQIKYNFRPAPDYSDGLPNAPLPPDEALPDEPAPQADVAPVGGTAEYPGVAEGSPDSAQTPADGGESSAGAYGALFGGIAAATFVLGAGAWYARRRWIR
jgi:hypothetical protein